ncbi:MAG: hypothetical protein AAF962_06460 [Actinomycetota bacterium]
MHRRPRTPTALLTAAALLLAACAADEPEPSAAGFIDDGATMIVANSPGTLSVNGPQRVMVALVGTEPNSFFGDAELDAELTFFAPDGSTTVDATAEYLATEGVALGLYVATASFDQPGRWSVALVGTEAPGGRTELDVAEESLVPEPGDPAPASETPVATALADIADISTDSEPNPDFYDLTVAEAVANGRPTVIAFATPAFCLTALCGPTMDTVKRVVGDDDAFDVVHVEPYDIDEARAGQLIPVESMFEWQLVSEPWVFVVDDEGLVTASFEGTVGAEELGAAVDAARP